MRRILGIRWQVLLAGVGIAAVVVVGVVFLVRALTPEAPPPATAASEAPQGPGRQPTPAGPRLERLRDGAAQVADPETARRLARDALGRVEAELAATVDPIEIARLERKRRMILDAMERFGEDSPGR